MASDPRKALRWVAEALKDEVCLLDESLIDELADRGVDIRPAVAWRPVLRG